MPMTIKFGRMVTYHTITWPFDHVVLQDHVTQTNSLLLHYQNAYDHHTWQDGSSPWWAATHEVAWLFDHVILRYHVTSQNHCISTITVPMTMKLGMMITYFQGFLTIKSHNALITWSCKVTGQTKIIFAKPECLWLQTWQNENLPCWVPTYKVTSPFDMVVLWDHVTN